MLFVDFKAGKCVLFVFHVLILKLQLSFENEDFERIASFNFPFLILYIFSIYVYINFTLFGIQEVFA